MSTQSNIHELLVQLQNELEETETISERNREIFDHLTVHIKEMIDKPETPHLPLMVKLETAIAEIEAAHPNLALTMERVLAGLSNMGV